MSEKVDLGECEEKGLGSGFLQARDLGGLCREGMLAASFSSGSEDDLQSLHRILNESQSFGCAPAARAPTAPRQLEPRTCCGCG
ncbi:hypothetical protein PAL_GLEAN10003889 [Pteropus alecto]|uniref:Uncharacterized protein n=1 Tax=Pteropus alecto TaxID=9402 RepID=L5L1U8_PTEAL|nr:hypothetical protein PAL_GLEAN10003889 [Pteropus alecto]